MISFLICLVGSLEKIVSLRDTLTETADNVFLNLGWAIKRLGENRLIYRSETDDSELKEGLIKLDDTDIKYIKGKYTESLWETMQTLLPHYQTDK